jgi:hypothetical protein
LGSKIADDKGTPTRQENPHHLNYPFLHWKINQANETPDFTLSVYFFKTTDSAQLQAWQRGQLGNPAEQNIDAFLINQEP